MEKKVVGCKVTAAEKKELEQVAAQLGMDKSAYLRALIFGNHEKLQQLTNLHQDLVVAPEYATAIHNLIQTLKSKYPNQSPSAIIAGSLTIALENEKRYLSNKLKDNWA